MSIRAAALSVPFLALVAAIATAVWADAAGMSPGAAPQLFAVLQLLGLLSLAGCAYFSGRLHPRRTIPDLRVPYLLNAAGVGIFLFGCCAGLLVFLFRLVYNI